MKKIISINHPQVSTASEIMTSYDEQGTLQDSLPVHVITKSINKIVSINQQVQVKTKNNPYYYNYTD